MRKFWVSRTSRPDGREGKGEGAREGAKEGVGGGGEAGQSCLVMAWMLWEVRDVLDIEVELGCEREVYPWKVPATMR
jgi:hypothetical protein